MDNMLSAIKRYLRGESKDEKVRMFEEYQTTMSKSREGIAELVADLNGIVKDADIVKAQANVVLNSEDITKDNVATVLDNIRFANASVTNYMSEFRSKLGKFESDLSKAEKGMANLISDNPDIANIILDVKHDDGLEKSLEAVLTEFTSGNVDRSVAVTAFKNAVVKRKTDRDFQPLLDKYLNDK